MFAKRFNNVSALNGNSIECEVGRCQQENLPLPLDEHVEVQFAAVVACALRNTSAVFGAAPPEWYGLYTSKGSRVYLEPGGLTCGLDDGGVALLWKESLCPPLDGLALPTSSAFLVQMVRSLRGRVVRVMLIS